MPSNPPKTPYLELPLYNVNDSQTTFLDYWQSINLNADGTTYNLSAFQILDDAYHTLDQRIDNISAHVVQEYNNKSLFPATGLPSSLYIDKSTSIVYRWTGTAYTQINPTTDIEQAISELQQTVATMPDEIYDRVAGLINSVMEGRY